MPKKKESQAEREARIARLQELYASGRLEEILIPDHADYRRILKDVASGESEAERRLEELLKDTGEG